MEPSPVPIRVGTAGWSYEDWNGIVYPSRPTHGFDRLSWMASVFDTNEINSSFYRIPAPRTTRDWVRRVAHNPRFAFTAKLYQGFTHEREAGAAQGKEYLSAMEPLCAEGRLGCVLAQFPMSFRNTPENRAWLEGLLRRFDALPLAVEFRHESWNAPEVLGILSGHGAAFVNIDQPRFEGNLPPTGHVTAPVAYYRFHGRNREKWWGPDTSNEERYDYLYSERELAPWADRIAEAVRKLSGAAGAGEGAARGVYAILNNHFRGQAVANAVQLEHRLTGAWRAVPDSLRQAYPGVTPVTSGASQPQKTLF